MNFNAEANSLSILTGEGKFFGKSVIINFKVVQAVQDAEVAFEVSIDFLADPPKFDLNGFAV